MSGVARDHGELFMFMIGTMKWRLRGPFFMVSDTGINPLDPTILRVAGHPARVWNPGL